MCLRVVFWNTSFLEAVKFLKKILILGSYTQLYCPSNSSLVSSEIDRFSCATNRTRRALESNHARLIEVPAFFDMFVISETVILCRTCS